MGYYNRFITVNNSQLYLADNWPSSSRINIYNADETSAGPVLNSEDAITDQYVVLRDKILFFSGTSGSDSGFEPYVFDGSKIEIIQDYYSGPGNSYYSAFSNLVTMGDYAYMNITDGSSYHVCRTDGTVGNLTAITPAGMYQISNLTLLNSQLVFTGKENSGFDFILWKSNGTSEGTEELEDSTGETVVVSGNLIKINNKIYGITTRNGKSAIFVTDGTEYGTSILTDIPDGVSLNILHIHYPYLICNGRGGIYGQELWLYNLEDNSSINRPQMFRDMVTGGDFFNDPGSNSDEGPNATEYNNRIYFIDI
ncbi:MAG: hypothetical protein GXY14_06770, partial [Spirochaetes bacterium]|nr:hypothetical protein [Spirochaetota bacterium]